MNKQNAFQFWEKKWGRKKRSCDFAGRQIEKSAYMDVQSQYGWCLVSVSKKNPQLFCMHLKTYEEMGNNFPRFSANHKRFQVAKLENKLGIIELLDPESSDFFNAEKGLQALHMPVSQNNSYYVNYVQIQIVQADDALKTLLHRFVLKLFQLSCIYADDSKWILADFDQKDSQEILDLCIIFNTYAQHYIELKYGCKIRIGVGRLECEDAKHVDLLSILSKEIPFEYALSIDENMKVHTKAKNEAPSLLSKQGFYPYNYTFTILRKNLERLAG